MPHGKLQVQEPVEAWTSWSFLRPRGQKRSWWKNAIVFQFSGAQLLVLGRVPSTCCLFFRWFFTDSTIVNHGEKPTIWGIFWIYQLDVQKILTWPCFLFVFRDFCFLHRKKFCPTCFGWVVYWCYIWWVLKRWRCWTFRERLVQRAICSGMMAPRNPPFSVREYHWCFDKWFSVDSFSERI